MDERNKNRVQGSCNILRAPRRCTGAYLLPLHVGSAPPPPPPLLRLYSEMHINTFAHANSLEPSLFRSVYRSLPHSSSFINKEIVYCATRVGSWRLRQVRGLQSHESELPIRPSLLTILFVTSALIFGTWNDSRARRRPKSEVMSPSTKSSKT